MFDTIGGLPVHPLVVHAVVVLLPLAVLGTIAVAVFPRWRTRYAGINALVAVVGTALCPVATSSGEALEHRVGDPGLHAELGDQLLWFSLPMALLALILWWMQRRAHADVDTDRELGTQDREGPGFHGPATTTPRREHRRRSVRGLGVVAVLAVVAAIASGVQVYRVGDSGAKAVWADQMTAAPAASSNG
ncbi:hypothetical protein OG218_02880 [Kineococcus sp. NBC_00420]|uniref:DUF2231 domain-containing protein n=1 Tax=Kineococcus sp. NBC_00420 TaxID=2903564 RepID=UPI002E224D89